ncbi:DUF222 domain-containing protein [Georgenia sp. H159]|uniref:HNH endonuclease signature motif containing protein n=1 Tax=Georgenia sp. H159 TaxID=3076115 RepID=UPI002D77F28D|nr:DUF222 domain-containing protein [Georgenia sp. H159]
MSVIDDHDADPDSAWLHDPDPLTLDDAAREELLRFVDALEALVDDVPPPAGLAGAAPPDASDFVARPGLSPEALAAMAPDAQLAAELEEVDTTEVDEYYLVEMAAAYQRLAAWANARLTHVAGVLARRPMLSGRGALPDHVDAGNMAADELAPRLGLSRFACRRIVRNARGFASTFALTGHFLATGQIDVQKASTLVSMLEDYPDEIAVLVQDAVLDDAGLQTHSQLVTAIRKAVIAVSHGHADRFHAQARAKRRVDHPRQLPDGMASMLAILPATDAVALDLALEAATRTARANGDRRTVDQLRADTLALMGHAALENGYVGLPPNPSRTVAPPAPDGDDGAAAPSPADRSHAEASQSTCAAPAAAGGEQPPSTDPAAVGAEQPPRRSAAPPGAAQQDGRPGGPTTGNEGHGSRVPDGTAPPDTGVGPPDGGAPLLPHGRCMPIGRIGGRRTQVRVTVPLAVLLPPDVAHQLGLPATVRGPSSAAEDCSTDQTGAELVPLPDDDTLLELLEREPAEVAELEGYGPISPAVARAAALGGTWRRIVTDPLSGTVVDYGRARYRPPAALAELVRLRDGTCVRAGCSSPARTCQLDHVEPWSGTGTTSLIDLADLCDRDHLVKTSGAFRLRHLGGGDFRWTTPSGHTYRRHRGGRVTQEARESSSFPDQPPF